MSRENKQIKIKINGKDKQYNENSRSKNEEIAAGIAPSNKEQEFEWILPEPTKKTSYYDEKVEIDNDYDYYYSSETPSSYYNNKRKFGNRKHPNSRHFQLMIPKAVIASIISAIIIGVGLGFAVLLVFTDDKAEVPAGTNNIPVNNTGNSKTDQPKETASFGLDFSVVQGGVYSTTENASTAAAELKQMNVPSVVDESNGKYYVLIGIAGNGEITEQLESKYKGDNIKDAYAKAWSYKLDNVSIPNDMKKDWLVNGENILKQLITASGQAYSGTLEQGDLEKLQADFKKWKEAKPTKLAKEESGLVELINVYANMLDDGIKSLTGDDKMVAQQKALNAYMAYKSVISSLLK